MALRRRLVLALAIVTMAAGNAGAVQVDRLRSYWNDEHTVIYSDVVVTWDDGSQESRLVMGGTVDGIGMIKIPLFGDPTVDYVRTTATKTMAPLHWSGACVFLTPDSRGTKAVSMTDELTAVDASANAWNSQSCSYFQFIREAPEVADVGQDGRNIIKFREDVWAPGGKATTATEMYDPAATAITTVSFIDDSSRSDSGTILDADVEVNAINFGMGICSDSSCQTSSAIRPIEDIQNTLTHEFGHVLGLAHTCWKPDPKHPDPYDNLGHLVPTCALDGSLPQDIRDATMYPFQSPQEISKRSLSPDDINAICEIYPTAMKPSTCAPVSFDPKGGCAVAPGSGQGAWLVPVLWLLLVEARRRRRRHVTSL